MPNAAAPRSPDGMAATALLIAAITLARVGLLALGTADLDVDEAQYWLWAQEPAFGYYSKPPLIAWVIALSTGLAGSDAAFWVRLPAPLLHGATALILAVVARRLHSARAGLLTGAAYATLPMVSLGSLVISTDTVMLPFLAAALLLYLKLIRPGGAGRLHLALGTGLMLGLAFLAKYAALYFLAGAALAALSPRLRPDGRDALAILGVFAAVALPNLLWNLTNGLSTVSHTFDNTGWGGGFELDPAAMARFLAEQVLVFGPVMFPALLFAGWRLRRRATPAEALLVMLSLPILALVALQALVSGANANWGVAAYLSGSILAVASLMTRRFWLFVSFAANGALALALPLAATQVERLSWKGELLLARYEGRDELSRAILDEAAARGAAGIVAADRGVLADLFYTGRDAAIPVYAWPQDGPPRNHYQQSRPLPGAAGPVLAVAWGDLAPPCAGPPDITLSPGPGAYLGRAVNLWLVPQDCWTKP